VAGTGGQERDENVDVCSARAAAGGGDGPADHTDESADLSTPTGYTHVVEVKGPGKTVYISGQIALDKNGNLVGGGDMKAQAEQVFKNLEAALAAAGATFDQVVKMNTYTTDMSQVQAIRDVRSKYFTKTTPASTLVQVVKLARPDLLLEIEVIAAVP
jgi:reactive intermediate/imine deaminase